jgi:hypothetical protein
MEKSTLPVSQKNLIRILVVLCVILSLLGGFFHAQRKTSDRKYKLLQDRYSKLEQKYNTLLDDYAAALDGQKTPIID